MLNTNLFFGLLFYFSNNIYTCDLVQNIQNNIPFHRSRLLDSHNNIVCDTCHIQIPSGDPHILGITICSHNTLGFSILFLHLTSNAHKQTFHNSDSPSCSSNMLFGYSKDIVQSRLLGSYSCTQGIQ